MLSLSNDNQSEVIEAFNSRYLDDLLNIDNNFFDSIVNGQYTLIQLRRITSMI